MRHILVKWSDGSVSRCNCHAHMSIGDYQYCFAAVIENLKSKIASKEVEVERLKQGLDTSAQRDMDRFKEVQIVSIDFCQPGNVFHNDF